MHQLIVLGNGFDLECRLKSKFSNFFKPRIEGLVSSKDFDTINTGEGGRVLSSLAMQYGKQFFSQDFTIWDAVLLFSKNDLWKDVEEAIREFLIGKSSKTGNRNRLELIIRALTCPPESSFISIMQRMDSECMAAYEYLIAYYDGNREEPPQKASQLVPLLFAQLKTLEEAFGSYLATARKKNDLYEERSEELLKFLSKDGLELASTSNLPDTSVLDFNYTNPATQYVKKHDIHLVNIHGDTDDPIFGIDGKDLMKKPNLVRFTKTYRLLALNNSDRSKIIHTSTGSNGESTELIKFYGHSLGDADYSYFQAIFDGVGLYSSDTRLIFYYNVWLQDDGQCCDDETAQQDMFEKVTRLMTEYGETMTNKDHGENLMHKLLLEGRLTIKRYNG